MRTPLQSCAFLAALRSRDPLLPAIVDAAAREVEALLGVRFAARTIVSPRTMPSSRATPSPGTTPSPRPRRSGHPELGPDLVPDRGLDWAGAFLYRATYHGRRLEALLRRAMPAAFGVTTALVTDVEIQPPPDWRYVIFQRLAKGDGALVSLAPLDPRYWGERRSGRARLLKTRLRAALLAALGPCLGLHPCDEPGCWLDRRVDGVDSLDAMEALGRAHAPHPGVGRVFAAGTGALDAAPLAPAPRPTRRRHAAAFERKPARPLPVDVRWETGPAAALEIFHAERDGAVLRFERRHETPWASTIRPPVERVAIEGAALARVHAAMEKALAGAALRGVNVPRPPAPTPGGSAPVDELRAAGARLYDLFFPLALERGLVRKGVFLALGIDELLLDAPFELMHDRDDFLALKHHVGRFVNSSTTRTWTHRGPLDRPDGGGRRLRALVVGVPHAASAPGRPLPHAEAEARAAATALARLGARVTELVGRAATVDAVYAALRAGPHILHYSGHAELGAATSPARLLLADGDLDGAALGAASTRRPPAVAVLNACDAARVPSFAESAQIQGLIEPLLLAGSYVLAARWPVTDEGARAFAAAFYGEMLEAGAALGVAVTRAREAARRATPADDLTWAAYVLYGDPKLALRRR